MSSSIMIMVLMCLWGHISPQVLQRVMDLFMVDLALHKADKLDLSSVEVLAGLGSHGEHPNNIWRDLKNRLPAPKLPSLHSFTIPYKHTVLGFLYLPTTIILPHELFAAMYHNMSHMWAECICPSKEVCRKFWNCVRGTPQFASHPVRLLGDLSKCIPLRLHADGTPASGIGKSWGKLVDVFSLSSMLVFGSSLVHNFLIWMVHQTLLCAVRGHHTMETFWKKFTWSMDALAEGRWPTVDWMGKAIKCVRAGTWLMGGIRMYIWKCIGDLDMWCKTIELPNSNSNCPCALCPANATTHPWWHFYPSAAWIAAIYSAAEFMASGWGTCGLFNCPGVTIHSMAPDWMHVKHLGLDKVLLGSVIWILVNWVLPGDDKDAKLKTVWNDILRIYVEDGVKCRYGGIKMTMFSTNSTPKLKGKAAEIKCLGPVLVKVFQAYMDVELGLHRKILLLLRLSAYLDAIIDRNSDKFVLEGQERDDLVATGFAFLSLFYEVSCVFKDDDIALFAITAKAHYLMHICLLSGSRHFTSNFLCYGFRFCVMYLGYAL